MVIVYTMVLLRANISYISHPNIAPVDYDNNFTDDEDDDDDDDDETDYETDYI